MTAKVFRFVLCILFALSVVLWLGCERTREMVTPPSDTSAATASMIKIGLIQPGDHYVTFGRGAELAQAELNARGGVLGRQVEFIQKDNQTVPNTFPDVDKTIALATQLVEEEDIVALLGPIFSTVAVQVGPTIQALQRPTILGSAGTLANAAGDFIFLSVITNAFQGKVIADFAADPTEFNAKTAATIQQDQDVYSTGHVEAFVARFQELGGEIVASEVYQAGDTSFSEQLQRIQAANPDVILLSSFVPEVPLLIKEARDMDIETAIVGGDTWDEPEKFFNTLDDNTPLEGIYQTTNFAPEMPGAKRRNTSLMPIPLCLEQLQMVSPHRVMMRCCSWQTQLKRQIQQIQLRSAMRWLRRKSFKAQPIFRITMRIGILLRVWQS